MFRFFVAASVILLSLGLKAQSTQTNPDYIIWAPFSGNIVLQAFQNEIQKPLNYRLGSPVAQVITVPINPKINPLKVCCFNEPVPDFDVGTYIVPPGQTPGPIPEVSPEEEAWFRQVAAQGVCPKFFMIEGHQVISHGWHNDPEDRFMFLPTFIKTAEKYPEVRDLLNCVKVPLLLGCNATTNLEPHKADGTEYTQAEIKALYDQGGESRKKVMGTINENNTLEFYKERLAREYGPGNPEGHYDYERVKTPGAPCTRDVITKDKKTGKPKHNKVENLECWLPDSGLWDGTHRYNYPYLMKRLFPNASLIIGFSSASPQIKQVRNIFETTMNQSRKDLNGNLKPGQANYIENIIYPLTDPTYQDKEKIIRVIRRNWSVETFRLNSGRPSGSVTPAFPDLDATGTIPEDARASIKLQFPPAYGPYNPDDKQFNELSDPNLTVQKP